MFSPIAVAPMMDWTDRFQRYFMRLLTKKAVLYTEMVTAQAVLYGDQEKLLGFAEEEHPVVLQLGGAEPAMLAKAAKIGAAFGYDAINLNAGCPSSRVSAGRFGACLMLEPLRVADCLKAMADTLQVPVTLKCRIGVDAMDSYAALQAFIETVTGPHCQTVIVHARKAWLKGLSPKQNREIPPLNYDFVRALKKDFPHLNIIVNGGIATLSDVKIHLAYADGVMIGRAAYHDPYLLADIARAAVTSEQCIPTREEVIQNFLPYLAQQLQGGVRLGSITRHILGLYHGQRGAAVWRRFLSANVHQSGAGIAVLEKALALVAAENKKAS